RPQKFDFLPTSATTGKVLLFFPRRSWIEVWDGKFRWLADEQRWEDKWAEREEETFACPFSEDFYVFAKDTTYFFLTRSGQLYSAEKPKKGERQMKPAWGKSEPPISAVVTDAKTGTSYFFG